MKVIHWVLLIAITAMAVLGALILYRKLNPAPTTEAPVNKIKSVKDSVLATAGMGVKTNWDLIS